MTGRKGQIVWPGVQLPWGLSRRGTTLSPWQSRDNTKYVIQSGILRDKTIEDKLMYYPNYNVFRLKLLTERLDTLIFCST